MAGAAWGLCVALAGCAPSPLRAQEIRSGDSIATLTQDGACSTAEVCAAGVLEVEQDLVQTGVSSQVELSVALVPSVAVNIRENASTGTWDLDTSDVPPGSYLATLVISGQVSQAVLVVP